MDVFVTGATGYIGGAVAGALLRAGHNVTGLARSVRNARDLERRGMRVRPGDLLKPRTVAEAARSAQGIIHTANTNDAEAAAADRATVLEILETLAGTGKPFIYTSGIWVLGSTGYAPADENAPVNPAPIVEHRAALERDVLGFRERGVRAIVVRPAVVYGRAGGLLTMFVRSAREMGAARFIGDGENRWPFVFVEDLAQLYLMALRRAKGGSLFNAALGPSFKVREIAEAASAGAGAEGRTKPWPVEEARRELGPLVDALLLDQEVSSEKASRELGWTAQGPSVIEELRTGSYTQVARTAISKGVAG